MAEPLTRSEGLRLARFWRFRTIVVALVLLVLSTLLIGSFALRSTIRRKRREVVDQLDRLSSRGVAIVDAWWRYRRDETRSLANVLGEPGTTIPRRATYVSSGTDHRHYVLQGDSLANPRAARAIDRALSTGSLAFTPCYRSGTDSSLYLDLIAPIRGRRAVVMTVVDMSAEIADLFAGASGEQDYVIVARGGDSLVYVSPLRNGIRNSGVMRNRNATFPAAAAARGVEGVFEGVDRDGTQVVAYLRRTAVPGISLVTKIRATDAYTEISELRRSGHVVAAAVTFIGALLILVVWLVRKASSLRHRAEWQRRYLAIFSSIDDAVLVANERGDIVERNDEADRLFGAPGHLRDIAPPEAPDALESLPRADHGETAERWYLALLGADGVPFPAAVSARWFALQGRRHTIIVARDRRREIAASERLTEVSDALHEVEERFRNAFVASAIGMAIVGLDDRIAGANPALARMLGFERDDLDGVEFRTIVNPDDRLAEVRLAEKLTRGEIESYDLELRLRKRDGTDLWALMTVSGVRGPDGALRHRIAQMQDITARRDARVQLLDALAMQHAVFEGLEELVLVADTKLTIRNVLTPRLTILGRRAVDLENTSFSDIVDPATFDIVRSLADKALEENQAALEVLRVPVGGERSVLECSVSPLGPAETNAGSLVVVIRDITELARMIASVRASERRYRSLLDDVQLAAVGIDLDGFVTYVNPYLEQLLGVARDDVIGRRWTEQFVHTDYRDTAGHVHARMFSGEERDATMEYPVISVDWGERLIRWSCTAEVDSDERVTGVVCIGEDVTELRAADDALRTRQRRLEVMFDVSRAISENATGDTLIEAVLRRTIEALHCDAGLVRLLTPDGKSLVIADRSNFDGGIPLSALEATTRMSPDRVLVVEPGHPYHRLEPVLADSGGRGIVAPITEGGKLLGVMCLAVSASREATVEHEQLLLAVGLQLGGWLTRLRLSNLERERLRYADYLARLARRMSSARDYQETLDVVLDELAQLLDLRLLVFLQANLPDERLSIVAVSGADEAMVDYVNTEKPLPTGRSAGLIKSRGPVVYDGNRVATPEHANGRDLLRGTSVVLPLFEGERLLGVLEMSLTAVREFAETDIQFMEQLTELFVPELQKARLQEELGSLNRSLTATNVRRAEQLEHERDRMNAILQSVNDGLIVTDPGRHVVLANPAARRMFGMASEIDEPAPIESVLGEEVANEVLPPTAETLEEFPEARIEVVTGDGDTLTVVARTARVYTRANAVVGFVTVFRDMTRLKAIDDMKTEFISTAAHELRTPLTTLQGFTEILLTRSIPDKNRRRYLDYINRQSKVLGDIISDMLDVARLENDAGGSVRIEPCDLRAICVAEADDARQSATGHLIDVSGVEEVPRVEGEPDRLRQVLRNLLSNAIKYSPNGGRIAVACRAMPRSVLVSVADEGIGMTPGELERIFEKFYRADASTTAVPGTGLGMAIVEMLVHQYGGSVWVESEPGRGTTVSVALPRSDVRPLALIFAGRPKVSNAVEIGRAFRETGWDADVCDGVAAGLAAAQDAFPNVIVLESPSDNIVSTVRALSRNPRTLHIGVVCMANRDSVDAIQRVRRGRLIDMINEAAAPGDVVRRATLLESRRRSTVHVAS